MTSKTSSEDQQTTQTVSTLAIIDLLSRSQAAAPVVKSSMVMAVSPAFQRLKLQTSSNMSHKKDKPLQFSSVKSCQAYSGSM